MNIHKLMFTCVTSNISTKLPNRWKLLRKYREAPVIVQDRNIKLLEHWSILSRMEIL